MKNKIKSFAVLLICGICAICGLTASAQTNAAPQQTFFDTTLGYFTKFNTSLTNTFSATKHLEVWVGTEQNLGNTTAADLGIEYAIHRFNSTTPNAGMSLSLEGVAKNAGIAGALLAAQGGAGLNYTYIDAKFTAYLDGGYDFLNKRPYAEPGLRVKKALTDNTFAGLSISLPIERGFTGKPNVLVLTGFTF